MPNMDQGSAASRSRRFFSVTIVVELIVLAWFVVLLHDALRPDFRGGRFIVATLLLGTVLVLIALGRDIAISLWGGGTRTATRTAESSPADDESAPAPPWPIVLSAVVTMVGIFASVLLLGMLLGLTLAVWVVLIWQSKLDLVRALVGALAIGIVLPVVFAKILDLHLWLGLLPPIIPAWVGGGLLPPL